jgi:hypothetical protein
MESSRGQRIGNGRRTFGKPLPRFHCRVARQFPVATRFDPDGLFASAIPLPN